MKGLRRLPFCIFNSISVTAFMTRKLSMSCEVSAVRKQTVVVVGSGAIGLLYGSRLLEAEQTDASQELDVNFIFRRDFNHCSTHGFRVKSPDGDYYSGKGQNMVGKIHKDSSTIKIPSEGVDWVICAVKSYSLDDNGSESLKSLIAPMVGKKTRFLLIMNGLNCQRFFCDWFGSTSVFVGMAFVCVNRNNPSLFIESSAIKEGDASDNFVLVDHIAFGALSIGHCENCPEELETARKLWSSTKISSKVTVTTSLLHAQWSKLCWNIPFNGLSVALGGVSTDIIANDPDLRFIADRIMSDTISLGNEDIMLHHKAELLAYRGEGVEPLLKTIDGEAVRHYCWNLTDNMGPYKSSTVLDLVRGNDLELEYLFNQPLERARIISKVRRAQHDVAALLTGSTQLSAKTVNSGDVKTAEGVEEEIEGKGKSEIEGTDWIHLETVVRQVNAISRMALEKRKVSKSWSPTFILDTEGQSA